MDGKTPNKRWGIIGSYTPHFPAFPHVVRTIAFPRVLEGVLHPSKGRKSGGVRVGISTIRSALSIGSNTQHNPLPPQNTHPFKTTKDCAPLFVVQYACCGRKYEKDTICINGFPPDLLQSKGDSPVLILWYFEPMPIRVGTTSLNHFTFTAG